MTRMPGKVAASRPACSPRMAQALLVLVAGTALVAGFLVSDSHATLRAIRYACSRQRSRPA